MNSWFDVAIFGNGVLGNTLAFKLKRQNPNNKVAVIGPRSRSGAASMAAGAMLGCFAEVTKYTFNDDVSSAKFEMAWQAEQKWSEWIKEINKTSGAEIKVVEGTYIINNTESGDLDDENFDAIISTLKKYKQPYKEVAPSEIKGLHPVPTSRPLRAIYIPNEHAIDSHSLIEAIEAANKKLGVELIDDEVVAVEKEDTKIKLARLKSGKEIKAELYVSAMGSFTQAFLDNLPEAGLTIPALAGVGVAFTARRVLGEGFNCVVRTPNRSGSCGLHLVPLGNKTEYIGATNIVFRLPDYEANVGMSHFLMQCAMDQLDRELFFSRILEWRTGNRPVTIDGYPAIGWSQIQNLYLIYGTYRDGLHCSPEIAERVLSDLTNHRQRKEGIFSPLRKPISFGSQEKSINEFAYQAVCGAYENGLMLPRYTDINQLEQNFRDIAQRIYDELQVEYSFNPDVLHHLAFGQRSPDDATRIKKYLKGKA